MLTRVEMIATRARPGLICFSPVQPTPTHSSFPPPPQLLRYVTMMDYFVMACEIIFTFFIIYYLIEEIIEIKKHGLKYFKSVWNILDVIVVGISLVCIAFNVFCAQKVS